MSGGSCSLATYTKLRMVWQQNVRICCELSGGEGLCPPKPSLTMQEPWPWAADALYPSYLQILALLLARLWRRRHLSRDLHATYKQEVTYLLVIAISHTRAILAFIGGNLASHAQLLSRVNFQPTLQRDAF